MEEFDYKNFLVENKLTVNSRLLNEESQKINDVKSFLEDKGFKVEDVESGNEGHAEAAAKFKGMSDIEIGTGPKPDGLMALIWDGNSNAGNNKYDGKEAFYVYIPFQEKLKKEIESKFPVLSVSNGKGSAYKEVIIEK